MRVEMSSVVNGMAKEARGLHSNFQELSLGGSRGLGKFKPRSSKSGSFSSHSHPKTPLSQTANASKVRRRSPAMKPEACAQDHKLKRRRLKRRDVQPSDVKEGHSTKALFKNIFRKVEKRIRRPQA